MAGARLPRTGMIVWSVATGVTLVASTLFVQTLVEGYLILAAVATVVSLGAAGLMLVFGNGLPLATALVMALFCVFGWKQDGRITRVDNSWDIVALELRDAGLDQMTEALTRSLDDARERARRALQAPQEENAAFRYLSRLAQARPEHGILLQRAGRWTTWAGVFRMEPDYHPRSGDGVAFSDFFVVLHAGAAGDDGELARATILLQALPPADRLSASLERDVARATGTSGFAILPPGTEADGTRPFVVAGDTLALVRALPLVQGQVRLGLTKELVAWGALLVGFSTLLFLGIVWRRYRTLLARGLSMVTVLACVAIMPFNDLSDRIRLFDAGIYYSPVAGPLSANAGTLLISAAIILLALLALLRSQTRLRSRGLALWLVGGIAVLGPFLLRDLARGISPPAWGSSALLWLSLQAALFMAACVVLLAGATAGRAVVGVWKGLPASIAVVIAAVAAASGPLLLTGAARYPGWYPFLWIVSIAALALTRPARGVMLSAAAVAALGAATLTWSSSIKQRVILAERDVAAASVIDPTASFLLERFGRALASGPAPRDRSQLLRAYVNSDLAVVPYPLELFVWDSTNHVTARLSLSRIATEPELQEETVIAARSRDLVVQREVSFIPGAQMLIAAPHPGGSVTTAVVAPRTRIVQDDPYLSLLGLGQERTGEPPYTISLTPLEARAERPVTRGRWERIGDVLHGEWDLPDYRSGVHADVEVDLRSYDVLIQRGTLVLLFDLLLFLLLWALAVSADGSLGRWLRSRRHSWGRSYRARLTVALFGFFIIPAGVFAIWSHRTVLSGDRQARDLVLTEKLRAAEDAVGEGMLASASASVEAPLFVYENGRLVATSDSLFLQLSPLGRRLPPGVFRQLELGEQQTASQVQRVGFSSALVSYRRIRDPNQGAVVLAAPARADDIAIDRRSRDLGVLALFITAVGALAALALSGIAARQLARPIGILRGAALAIAKGERTPALPQEPRSEFAAVFAAFSTMATDLNMSRGQLVAAQRRTEAILRNVASGVVAFDRDARVALANPRSAALLGARLEPGMMLNEVKLPSLEKQVSEFLAGMGDDREFDLEIAGRQMHGWLTRLASGDGGAVLTLDDVSEMARAQRVLAWGQMARQVAHEIKNPLTPIRLGVQHLRRAHLDRHADFDRILNSNVARILSEIDRLDEIARAFSRYGVAPTQTPDVSPVDVGDIARDVVALERMGEGEVEWRYEESEGSLLALASEDELREVLLNLLENARHAGARVVTMTVSPRATTVVVEVMDDGHGIPEDVLPRIFEPNFSTRSSGSGLGLAISRKLIEGWGGQISVTSAPAQGARVTILLLAPREL